MMKSNTISYCLKLYDVIDFVQKMDLLELLNTYLKKEYVR